MSDTPARGTIKKKAWVYYRDGFPQFADYGERWEQRQLISITTNLEDGLPVSGSWEAVD